MSFSPQALRGRAESGVRTFGDAVAFSGKVLAAILNGRVRAHLGEAVRQSSLIITGSFVVILGMVLALGLVVGIQGSYAARQVGAPAVAGAFAAIGDLREITPYAFGYMFAAKVSTGIVAEIGTMRINDEVDALDVMGIDSPMFLCSTRLLGIWIVLPFLYAIAIVVGYFGSYVAVVWQVGQVSPGGYFELFWKFQNTSDYLFSALKAFSMATFVVLVGCYYGFRVRGGPVQVGHATARAMIVNLVGIHFIGIVGSQLFWGGRPRLPIGG